MAASFAVLRRTLSTTSTLNAAIKHVTVVGGGNMGSGIAQVTVQSGISATIVEANDEAIRKSQENIKRSIQRVAKKQFKENPSGGEKFIQESLGRLKHTLDLNETVKNTDLVIEAIIENIEAKRKLFALIDPLAPNHTMFASNTSSLSISEMAEVTKRLDRFGGLHFFNPVPVMKLLEVIRIPETSDETYNTFMEFGKIIGKTTITCKDTPGFVVNRLLVPFKAEALRMLERGDAPARDIDTAMKLGAGHPMGPFELSDYVGIDISKSVLDGWHKKFPENPLFKPIPLVDKMVKEGKIGIKAGEGFYKYNKD